MSYPRSSTPFRACSVIGSLRYQWCSLSVTFVVQRVRNLRDFGVSDYKSQEIFSPLLCARGFQTGAGRVQVPPAAESRNFWKMPSQAPADRKNRRKKMYLELEMPPLRPSKRVNDSVARYLSVIHVNFDGYSPTPTCERGTRGETGRLNSRTYR